MKKSPHFIILICTAITFPGCLLKPSPLKKLEGKWIASGSMDEYHAWYLEYTFKGNAYQMTGYPPISEEGTMKVKESNQDSMLVEFIVKKSDPVYENHRNWIRFDGEQFHLNGNVFSRKIEEKVGS